MTREEMFQSYKADLLRQARKTNAADRFFDGTVPPITGWTRYGVIQYVCSFPNLDPVRMAAAIMREGIKVYFDNMNISDRENKAQERAAMKEMKRLEGLEEALV